MSFLACAFACSALASGPLDPPVQERVTAFVDVTVIPMDRERSLPNQTVVVRDLLS